MNFKIVLTQAAAQTTGKIAKQVDSMVAETKGPAHRLAWRALEASVRHRIKRETGKDVTDWKDFIDLIIKMMPVILAIAKLLLLFA